MSVSLPTSGFAYVGVDQSIFGEFQIDVNHALKFDEKVRLTVGLGQLYGSISVGDFNKVECRATFTSNGTEKATTVLHTTKSKYKNNLFEVEFTTPKSNALETIDACNVYCFIDALPRYATSTASYTTPMNTTLYVGGTYQGYSMSTANFKTTFVNALSRSMSSSGAGVPIVKNTSKDGFHAELKKINGRIRQMVFTLDEGFFHTRPLDGGDADHPPNDPATYDFEDGKTDSVSCEVRLNNIRHLRNDTAMTRHTLTVTLPTAYESRIGTDIQVNCRELGVTKSTPGMPTYIHIDAAGYDDSDKSKTFFMASRIEMKNAATFTSIALSAGVLAASALAYFF